jgi:hypothetical protein
MQDMHKRFPYRLMLVAGMLLSVILLHAGKSTTCCKSLKTTVAKPVEKAVAKTAVKAADAIIPSIIIF